MKNNTINNIEDLFHISIDYAKDNNINDIIIFAKGIENVLRLNEMLKDTEINLYVTTFPHHQLLYIENEEGEIDEIYPEILEDYNQKLLKENNITLISSTLPLDPIITPGIETNPYHIINQTLNLFGHGTDIVIQSALMASDNGVIKPGSRVLSLISNLAADLETANSRFLFHPKYGIKINHIIK
ncbi:hypothetical protein [Streptococcus uberis]|uniref:hypothetical protein n=1 Tax=Streptococcus uberis TaxID=1349 RepID=UPI0006226568|nr:hypothetical protein [Streptococcus uberis]KKF41466.1 hypothetical protein AF61_01920 [Streptococcus uberis EF20/0145]QBX12095.1 hypothetical protein JavanS634_0002 [Streptococcus satellite phage Javan634]